MPVLARRPPYTRVEPVTEVLHGVSISDPYRWLEDQNSPETRAWIEEQTLYARAYLDSIPGRERIRERVRELVDVETYDSLQVVGSRYFFRKRVPGQEQPFIYFREGPEGKDQLLIDPNERGTGKYTAVKPLRVSSDGRLLLYEVKQGGERAGTFELLEIETRKKLPDFLPRGYLRGFAFAADNTGFHYVHEPVIANRPWYRAAYYHALGTGRSEDREVFFAGEDPKSRLVLQSDNQRLIFMLYRFHERTLTDIYWSDLQCANPPNAIVQGIDYRLVLKSLGARILGFTNRDAPNRRIVEIRLRENGAHEWVEVVPECDARISTWLVVRDSLVVSYEKHGTQRICWFNVSGQKRDEMEIRKDQTIRLIASDHERNELLFEAESFTEPTTIVRYAMDSKKRTIWASKTSPLNSSDYRHQHVWYTSRDGSRVPMLLAGRRDVLETEGNPTIMTSYGGFGVSMSPQFSVFVGFLMEHGCLFALPNVRGGSEFGTAWHDAGKRRRRQTVFDDFLSAAEWLIHTRRTTAEKLAIFGGSNSGLLVAAALTQRPDLFRAVVCMVPILDMLRYHLFDSAHIWTDEFGTADKFEDFVALKRYSPYHQVRDSTSYPAVMLTSGDADHTCNSLHARKMVARLQAANVSDSPVFLDYSHFRGHSPVLPLSARVDALTDRMAFLCDQLQLPV